MPPKSKHDRFNNGRRPAPAEQERQEKAVVPSPKVRKAATDPTELRLGPKDVHKLQRQIYDEVERLLPEAVAAIRGDAGKMWTPTQARLFSNLLNKVTPDLQYQHIQHDIRNKDFEELSRDELERIASGEDTS